MGVIARVLSFVRRAVNGAQTSDVKLDPGGGPNRTAQHFAAPGDDSHPLAGDYCYAAPTPRRGGLAVLGYVDPVNAPASAPGERRLYARDPQTGDVTGEVWLKSDGAIEVVNGSGSFRLLADGTANINGVTIDASGVLRAASVFVGGVQVAGHTHTQAPDAGGDAQQPTGGMI